VKIRHQESSPLLRWGVSLFSLFCVLLLSATLTFGQTDTGQISGTVSDSTGAVLVGAKVEAKATSTGTMREATTNSSGYYTMPGLRPDKYEITISAAGFERIVRHADVTVSSILEISAQMKIGNATTTVEVLGTTDINSVNTESSTLSETITGAELNTLPTSPTRNPYALVGTSGNVTEDTQSNRGAGFAVNGMRSASTSILLDGGENVDTFTATVGQVIPLDSVQEFTVLTNNFGAEYGRASGGVVNLVTKSGTNAFHGSAYEFNRVAALSANTIQNDSTDTPKGGFTRNNFGFAVGGPIKKDKLFFFNNTEWIRVRSSAPLQLSVLDPGSYGFLAQASQDFFTAYGGFSKNVSLQPLPTLIDSNTNQPFTDGRSCSAAVANLQCDQATFNVPADAGGGNPQNTTLEVARVDWNINSTTTFYGRYASFKELDFDGVVNASPYAGYNTGQSNYDQNYDFSISHFFTPVLANTAKVTFNRLNGPVQPLSSAPVSPTLYTAGSIPSVGGTQLIFPGYSEQTPGNAIPFGGPQNLYQFHDDISWTKGKHQLKFGGQFIQLRDNRVFGAYENPVELLGTNLTSGLTNLTNGTIFQFSGAVSPQGKFPCVNDINTGTPIVTPECTLTLPVGPPAFNRNYWYNDGAVYAQDSWKVMPRLTLNAGLRWEYYGVQHNANESLDSNFVFGPGATIFDKIRNGQVKLAKDGGVFWHPNYHNFGPRVGLAWDVRGNGKTALRAGYGISYERNFGNVTYNTIQNPPAYAVVNLINASVNIKNGVPTGDIPFMPVYTDVAGPLSGTGTKALPVVSQRAINQNLATAYAEVWNASVDQAIGKGVLSISYAGSHGIHLYDIANINLPAYGGTFLGDTRFGNRLNLGYGSMNFRSDNGYSHYNAFNIKYGVTNMGNKGVGVTANYTYSHSLDNISSTFTDGYESNYGLGYVDAFNPKLNYGNSDFDIRHRLNIAATWDVPYLKHAENKFVRAAFGGWSMGAIFNVRSGLPYSIFDCNGFNGQNCPLWAPGQNVSHSGSASAIGGNLFNYSALPTYADTTCDTSKPPVCTGPSIVGTSRDFSADSFGTPVCTGLFHVGCTYTPSGTGYPDRNQFKSPGFWNADMIFSKSFQITERVGLQFRGEFYNIFNHHNQYINVLNLDVSSMTASSPFVQTEKGGPTGVAGTATDERRNIQLGLRLSF
jgi:outer membrane receptor protein involved in Fe transport